MRTVFTFLGAFLVSFLVAMIAAHQLAEHFRASEAFILVLMAVPAFVPIPLAAFAIAYPLAQTASVFHKVALVLVALVVVLVVLPGMAEKIAGRWPNHPGRTENAYLALELLVPALLAVLVQWGMVRRRWLRARGMASLSRFPWITAVVAALIILSPLGLAYVTAALNRSPTNWLRDLFLTVTLASALALVVMGGIECYIRGRMLRPRLGTAA